MNNTVEQDISADTLFPRLGDFAVPRILIFADAGTEHYFYCFTVTYFLFLLNRGHLFSRIGCQPRKPRK